MNTTKRMREVLQPAGSANISRLLLNNQFFDWDFIQECIAEIERLPIKVALGERPSNLEKLAYALLCDSAYIGE